MTQANSSQYPYALDENGIPVMPDGLAQFSMMNLNPRTKRGQAQIRLLAEEVYEIWEDNGFKQVKVIPKDRMEMPSCWDTEKEDKQNFDGVFPDRKDYDYSPYGENEEHDEQVEIRFLQDFALAEIRIANAKQTCSSCPLKATCLSASMTHPHRGRDGQVDPHRLRYDITGVWGGFGRSGREMVFNELLQVWGERDPHIEEIDHTDSVLGDEDTTEEEALLAELSEELDALDQDLEDEGIFPDLDIAV